MLPDSVAQDYLAGDQGNRFAGSMRYVRSYPAELPVLASRYKTATRTSVGY